MANEIIKTQLHPQKPADETDIIYPETSADQVKGLPTTSETEKKVVVMNKDGYSLMPYNAPTQIRVGETQTLPEGYQASVQNVGTPEAPVIIFQIPQGKTGAQGPRGLRGETGVGGQTFYILSHDIRNGVGDVTLSVPASEFAPTIEAVEGEVVRGISQPSGALFSALPDYNSGVFAGTFTVTTLGYAGVAHGGTIDKTLDINANVHIGRGNPDAKLFVNDIRGEKSSTIFISSNVLFGSDLFIGDEQKPSDGGSIELYSDKGDALKIENGGIDVLNAKIHNTAKVGKLSVNKISRTGESTLPDSHQGSGVLLETSIDAGNHRIFNCKINTNKIPITVTGLVAGDELHFINIYDGTEFVITNNGNYEIVFPCILYMTSTSLLSRNVSLNTSMYKGYIIGEFVKYLGSGQDIDLPRAVNLDAYYICLTNYNRPIEGGVIEVKVVE